MAFSTTTLPNTCLFVNNLKFFHWECCYVLVDNRPVSLYYFNRCVKQNRTTYLSRVQPTQERKVYYNG